MSSPTLQDLGRILLVSLAIQAMALMIAGGMLLTGRGLHWLLAAVFE